jgi:hypothetical protein
VLSTTAMTAYHPYRGVRKCFLEFFHADPCGASPPRASPCRRGW